MPRSIDEVKKEVWSLFKDMQSVYLATVEADQPRVRPVTLLDLDEKFWIATSTRSAKTRQILRNPNVEFCLPLQDESGQGYLRVSGVASLVTDRGTLESIGPRIPFLSEYWKGVDDPDFCLIRITRVELEYMKPGELNAITFMV
jgi:general stress protein 26